MDLFLFSFFLQTKISNRVIVGLQLITVENILTFQIMQAPLIAHFYVNASASTIKWKNVTKAEITKDKIVEPNQLMLTMKELTVPENTVLTGIGFRYDSKDQLDIQLKYTPVLNASAGTLDVKASGWMAEKFDYQRYELLEI
jgi:hypothetical protein